MEPSQLFVDAAVYKPHSRHVSVDKCERRLQLFHDVEDDALNHGDYSTREINKL